SAPMPTVRHRPAGGSAPARLYFKQPHFERYPHLHGLFNEATKLAGAGGTKGAADPAVAEQLLGKIEEISKIFWETKQS
ncbi:superoxide dismutase [Ni], partial [Micromonospora sp. NPDC047753]|uniref:superoxide dismutase [Ni] n=1 Tax=Micromonospora sp. NPDC047753 TaxID=3154817 RepID=UPI0033CE861A